MSLLTWTRLTDFDAITVRQQAPESAGVYRLCYLARDGKYYVFYVGQASNLKERLLAHLLDSEPNGCIRQTVRGGQCAFQYVVVTTSFERDRIEREQINEYDPKCNKL